MISHQTNSKNLEQYLVGLTGNVCSGKSKAGEYFKELGAYVLDLDKVVHDLYREINIPLKYDMYKTFGLGIFNKKLEIDRKKLGKIVFSDKSEMRKLENIIWPYVEKRREKKIKGKKGIIIIEAAMLYESGLDKKFDKNILVIADEDQQIKRLMKRSSLTKKEALKRIRSQMPQRDKIAKSDYIILNNETLQILKTNVEYAWEFLNTCFLYKEGIYLLQDSKAYKVVS